MSKEKLYPLLDQVQSPEDLKALPVESLPDYCSQLRQRIIDVMSVKGGHLASNLGSVELITAMHYVFSSPNDKMVYDTGHQAYPHKLITGRNDRFETIRQYGGLGGFTNPEESAHDHFHAGHAGTALSQALGTLHTRDLSGDDYFVLPFLGDAAFTCGLTLEALNNLPSEAKRLILILNDNTMAISRNVGAISNVCSRLVNNATAHHVFHEVEQLLSKVPAYGGQLAKQGRKLRNSLSQLVSPTAASFFSAFGLNYIGPVDGHNVIELVEHLEHLKEKSDMGPIVLHALTNKGQGMDKAIQNPVTYHGVKPFDPSTGDFHAKPPKTSQITFPALFGQEMLSLSEKDPSIVTVTPAMSKGSCLDALREKYPNRCIDVGIAEGHCVTFAGGMAYGKKMKVVACVYATFLQRALDNLFHDVCLQELPVIFALDRGGIAGGDGITHNGIYDIAFLQAMPNMIIAQPRNGTLMRDLLHSAFSWNSPCAIRYPNTATEVPQGTVQYRKPGEAEVLAEGEDVLLISLGVMNDTALAVRDLLKKQGVSASVVDPIFVKPLDEGLLRKLMRTHRKIVTIEEHVVQGGLGTAINQFVLQNNFHDVSVLNLGIPDQFVEHGSRENLLTELGLTPEQITEKISHHFSLQATASAGI